LPKVTLTYHDKIETKIQKMTVHCLGVKQYKKMSWEYIANEMFMPRSTIVYRFNNGLFTLSEWIEFWHILGIEKEDIYIFLWDI
jgi:hypothetical protein